jgi:hypothetical protein
MRFSRRSAGGLLRSVRTTLSVLPFTLAFALAQFGACTHLGPPPAGPTNATEAASVDRQKRAEPAPVLATPPAPPSRQEPTTPVATAEAVSPPPATAVIPDGGGNTPQAAALPCLDFSAPRRVGEIRVKGLFELSGLAASRAHPGVLYAHGDSGRKARVFAIDTTGAVRADYRLENVERTDWEDIAVGPGPDGVISVFVGDIGDNGARKGDRPMRDEIQIYRFAEPELPAAGAEVKQSVGGISILRFAYPDRPHDAETLMVDPATKDILIVTKEVNGRSTVYRAPGRTAPNTRTVLERVMELVIGPAGTPEARATAGDISPTGDRILIRTYGSVLLWARSPGQSIADAMRLRPRHLVQPAEPKGEAIAFSPDGKSWFAAGEEDPGLFQADATCP